MASLPSAPAGQQIAGCPDLLDAIAKLPAHLRATHEPPMIVVCGARNAGKSSVIEALTGLPFVSSFPSSTGKSANPCARFVTEVVMRRAAAPAVGVTVVAAAPTEGRQEQEAEFAAALGDDVRRIGDVVREAEQAVGGSGTLTITLAGPDRPHLTLVDLPGEYADTDASGEEEAQATRQRYMGQSNAIILAVLPAATSTAGTTTITTGGDDHGLLELARALDPEGQRTLAVVTKPDAASAGSIAQHVERLCSGHLEYPFQWHVVRNPSDPTSYSSCQVERDAAEDVFFARGPWSTIPARSRGARALRTRVRKMLERVVFAESEGLASRCEAEAADCREELALLAAPRATPADQRRYLTELSTRFSDRMAAAVGGDGRDDETSLRAEVQNRLVEFGEAMKRCDADGAAAGAAAQAKEIARAHRGVEAAGMFSPRVASELLATRCRPWGQLAAAAVADAAAAARRAATRALDGVQPEDVRSRLERFVLTKVDALERESTDKVAELLGPHAAGRLAPHGEVLALVQAARADRRRREVEDALRSFLGGDCLEEPAVWTSGQSLHDLMDALAGGAERELDDHAAWLAADFAEAQYKLALPRFVDNVGHLAVEQCLLGRLAGLLTAAAAAAASELDDETVALLVAETAESAARRARLSDQLTALEDGLRDLEYVNVMRPQAMVEALTDLHLADGGAPPSSRSRSNSAVLFRRRSSKKSTRSRRHPSYHQSAVVAAATSAASAASAASAGSVAARPTIDTGVIITQQPPPQLEMSLAYLDGVETPQYDFSPFDSFSAAAPHFTPADAPAGASIGSPPTPEPAHAEPMVRIVGSPPPPPSPPSPVVSSSSSVPHIVIEQARPQTPPQLKSHSSTWDVWGALTKSATKRAGRGSRRSFAGSIRSVRSRRGTPTGSQESVAAV